MTSLQLRPEERLLQVASRLFYAEGIHAVGVDRVISEASIAKATLYAHYAGKAELVSAYLAQQSQRWVEEAQQLIREQGPGTAEAVLSLFQQLYRSSRESAYRGCPFINAAAEFPGSGPVATEVALHRQQVRAVFVQAGGRLLAAPWMLDAMVALYGGAMSASHLDRDPEVVLHAAEAASRLLEVSGS